MAGGCRACYTDERTLPPAVHCIMGYALLASLTLAVHAAFVTFVVCGALVVYRYPRVALLHVPAVLWGAFVEFSGRICPLTPLENRFRSLAGSAGYTEGFLDHYVLALLYPQGLDSRTQCALGVLAISINGAAYAALWWRRRRSRT